MEPAAGGALSRSRAQGLTWPGLADDPAHRSPVKVALSKLQGDGEEDDEKRRRDLDLGEIFKFSLT